MEKEYDIYVCDCMNLSHQIVISRFDFSDGEPDHHLYITVHTKPWVRWYVRFWKAFKFAFVYDDGDFYDSTLLNKNDVIRLRDSMNAHLAVLEASENKVKPELPLVFDETNLSKVE